MNPTLRVRHLELAAVELTPAQTEILYLPPESGAPHRWIGVTHPRKEKD